MLKEQLEEIAAFLYINPQTFDELISNENYKYYDEMGLYKLIKLLEGRGAVFYKKGRIHIKKLWAMNNLQGYELDFRRERQRFVDSLSILEREFYGV